ncbi:hypothetical protein [Brucella pituitosa]|uniref:hypothetical protein n=1 Tax=Brucella pituitosa TaxID=571256 RepID=UPI0009A1E279|nr:hypothetical protein [Brucella pituitosa]
MKYPDLASLLLSSAFLLAGAFPSVATTYTVQYAQKDRLQVRTDRGAHAAATTLVLRGVENGLQPQVDDVFCDGKKLDRSSVGTWQVFAGCRQLSWTVPLDKSGASLPVAQRSLALESGVLLSEGSSLPRLADASEPEIIKLPAGRVFPFTIAGKLQLPAPDRPFLFTLIGDVPMIEKTSGHISLFYFLDQANAKSRIADMSQHLAGLHWLTDRLHAAMPQYFSVLWMAIPQDMLSLSGQTGEGLLLVNYVDGNAAEAFGEAMRLYVPLHEAVHQLAASDHRRPVWYDESLASYLAVQATMLVTHNSPDAVAMFERFKSDGSRINSNLIAIDRHVTETGDAGAIAAFYTKGVAFWASVDAALQIRGESLADYAATLATTGVTDNNRLPDFIQSTLHLPPDIWWSLEKAYLL